MKILLLAALFSTLTAASAHALPCTAAVNLKEGNVTYLTAPALIVNNDTKESLPFVTGPIRHESFGDNLCQACGFGSRAVNISFDPAGLGNNFAVLDNEGKLERIGLVRTVAMRIESLSCAE